MPPEEAGEHWLPASFFDTDQARVAVLTEPGDIRLLSDDERQRCAVFASAKRRAEFIRGRTLLRRVVGETRGVAPATVRVEKRGTGELTLPEGGAAISLTHTHALSAVALGVPSRLLGLDVERIRPVHARLMQRVTAEGERHPQTGPTALVVWTAKEAILKALGSGLRTPMSTISIAWQEADAGRLVGRCVAEGKGLAVCVRVDADLIWALATEETDT